jgi:hypothetical protein
VLIETGIRNRHVARITGGARAVLKAIAMTPATRLVRRVLSPIGEAGRRVLHPQAHAFYKQLMEGGYAPNEHIDVIPAYRLVYVCIPKCASSRIKNSLSRLIGRSLQTPQETYERKLSGLKAPKHVSLATFLQLATDPSALRFSFVRNPYARLVSCWASKFQDQPLLPGRPLIDRYLMWQRQVDSAPFKGMGQRLSFAEFVTFATATANERIDPHWERQVNILDMPGIELNFVGRVESFQGDFVRVLDHVGADAAMRRESIRPLNVSDHEPWPTYFTQELAEQVYRAYEEDFDLLKYPRKFAI